MRKFNKSLITEVATSGSGGATNESFEGRECISSLGSSSGSPRFQSDVSTLRISRETSEKIDVARQDAGARFRKIWCNSFVVVDLEKRFAKINMTFWAIYFTHCFES